MITTGHCAQTAFDMEKFVLRFKLTILFSWLLLATNHICSYAQGIPGLLPPHVYVQPSQTVIGDLGGAPVAIPREWISLVEYEGDPHWLEKRKDPAPKRTFESKLVSFGLLMHLSTMKPLTQANEEAYKKRSYRDVEWVSAGVRVEPYFFENGGAYFQTAYTRIDPGHANFYKWTHEYEKIPDVFGLAAWRARYDILGKHVLDDENRKHDNHHYYFAYEGKRIIASIKCSSGLTRAPGGRHTCNHRFVLWPEMKAEVDVRYPPDQLAHWREYQSKFKQLLLGFRVPTQKPADGASSATSR
jgi:hypothetical protein